jgi:hypothetical protein
MVERWFGLDTSEADAHARLLPVAGLPTAAHATEWKFQFLDWDEPQEREVIFGHLARGLWLIVDVYPGPLTMRSVSSPSRCPAMVH